METNKQIKSEFTANVALSLAPTLQSNGWTVGKNFFAPVARKQQKKLTSFYLFHDMLNKRKS